MTASPRTRSVRFLPNALAALALSVCAAGCSEDDAGSNAASVGSPTDMPTAPGASTVEPAQSDGMQGPGMPTPTGTPTAPAAPVTGPVPPEPGPAGTPSTTGNPPVPAQPTSPVTPQPTTPSNGGAPPVDPVAGGAGPVAGGGSAGTPAAGAGNPGGGGAAPDPGGDLPPNPSGLPEPGAGGVARPSGSPANLDVLPWAGFQAAVSYTFDDANSTQINNEEQLLGLGVPFTWYLQTGKQEAGNAFYQRALDAGHEIGNHTQSHGSGAADNDINQAQQFIMSQYAVTAYTMAAPNGNSGNYTSIAQQLFIIDRGVRDALIGPDENVNLLDLPSYIPPTGAGTSQLNPKVDAAQNDGKWLTVCIHGFSGGSDGAYQPIDLNGFVEHVEYVKDKGDVWIGSMLDVGAYFIGRKAVAAATAEMQGDDQVFSWTLPNVFPPGRYVRVVVDGGTPSQDGVPLPWNEHGFYEVALDVGTLTLSP